MSTTPLFKFGIISDVQYADEPPAYNFAKTKLRDYRNAGTILAEASKWWREDEQNKDIMFIAQLGDLIDGKNNTSKERSTLATKAMLAYFAGYQVYHLIGNHELYNFNRVELNTLLNTSPGGAAFYSFSPFQGFRFLVLDPFDLSTLNKEDPQAVEQAFGYLSKHNSNDLRGTADWTAGLTGLQRRFLPYNGGFGDKQLSWLNQSLAQAQQDKEKVILLSHVAVVPGCCEDTCVLWNYEDVVQILDRYAGVVVAGLYGHDHDGGYIQDNNGVHHITFEAPLECLKAKSEVAYARMDVYPDRLELIGIGKIGSRTLPFIEK